MYYVVKDFDMFNEQRSILHISSSRLLKVVLFVSGC